MIAWEGWWYYETLDPPTEDRNLVPISNSMVWPWLVTALDDADGSGAQVLPSPAAPLGGSSASSSVGPLPPGSVCPTCNKRIPHPKKSTSPKTRGISHRLPADTFEDFNDNLKALTETLGVTGRKHCYGYVLDALVVWGVQHATSQELEELREHLEMRGGEF
jgi:hypothetical protein